VSPARPSSEDSKPEIQKTDRSRPEGKDVAIVTKRKYRRHPKPDENAPERPPSAYVLFSNKMRDELKGRNLTFTEIAKLVGENWQSLSPPEKEPFERQALNAKEKYNSDMAEYKKTPEYRRYTQYLQDFKQKQASQNHAKDASKRLKLEPGPRLHGSSASATPRSGSVTGSGSDSHGAASEGPLTRKRRVGSMTSIPDTRYSPTIPHLQSAHSTHSTDEPMHSPTSIHFERDEMSPVMQHASPGARNRQAHWDGQMNPDNGAQQHNLPSLSDMFSDRMTGVTRTSESGVYGGFAPNGHAPPPLKHEPSGGSMGSSSSGMSYPRTPSDAALPIHALLSNKSGPAPMYSSPPSTFFHHQTGSDPRLSMSSVPAGSSPHNGMNGHASKPPLMKHSSTGSSGATEDSGISSSASIPSSRTSFSVHDNVANSKPKSSLDGMDALLRAGEIVGRRQ